MQNHATYYFVDMEESEATAGIWLPPSLSLEECMECALDYAAYYAAITDCGIETLEIERNELYEGSDPTATRRESEERLCIWLATATDHVAVLLPAPNGASTAALIAELLSANERQVVADTSGEPVVSYLCEFVVNVPISEGRSG